MLKCLYCDYITDRSYNLNRHMVIKHIDIDTKKENNLAKKENNFTKKENILAKKENIISNKKNIFECISGNENKNILNELQCSKCSKVFSSRWYTQKHEENCIGMVLSHHCKYCKKQFSFPTSKYRHQKICSYQKTQLIIPSTNTNPVTISTDIPSISNVPIEMHMHIHNTIQQNVTNNHILNQQNVVIYNPENLSFLTDHIDGTILKKILNQPSEKHIVSSYSRELLDRMENQCIRKTNLRSSHSQVHVGNNQWKSLLDKELYPQLMCSIANGFCDFLNAKQEDKHFKIRKHIFEKLIPFLDYLSDSGYCNDEERQKEVLENFNTLVQELKLIAFDISKKPKLLPSPSLLLAS
jgi:hypothetical protein